MKIKVTENFRVIVIPDEPWFLEKENLGMTDKNREKWRSACNKIVEEIKRHVDGFSDVYQDSDTKDVCSFCSLEWEENDDGGPVCCGKAVAEWERSKEK